MCFSAAANFVGSGVLAAVGVATLTQVKHRREIPFAAIPLLFALHQFTEDFVWLGLDGKLPPIVTHDAGAAFMLYAQRLLPLLLPLAVLLMEPGRTGKRRILPFAILGGGLTLYILWALAAFPTQVSVMKSSIVYLNAATHNAWVAGLYVVATCGCLFASEIPDMVWFGVANLTILLITMWIKEYAFTSVWCAYAAIAGLIIWFGLWRSRGLRPFRYQAI
jgi:hypothetical protein